MSNTTNMPVDGQAVKSSAQSGFTPNSPLKGQRKRKHKAAAPPAAQDAEQSAEDSNVVDIEQARVAREESDLDKHCIDQRSKKRKPRSLESIFAARLCRGYGGIGMWACQETEATGAVIYKWSGIYWEAVNNERGMRSASNWLEHCAAHAANARNAKNCWEYVAVRLPVNNPLPKLDTKRAIVPCADIYIEVLPAGFQALAPDPALGMVHAIKIKAGAVAARPYTTKSLPEDSLFAKFLARALPDPEVRAAVQEHCGMTLLPGNYSQAAWWYGEAGSGKSTLAELVEAMHRQSVRLNLETLGDRFSLEPLIGASLILVDEVECEKWAEGKFKSLVSGNGVGIDRKNEKALASYHSRAKWLITSNNPPFVRDKSNGVWRRLSPIYWGHSVPEKERVEDFHKVLLEQEGQLVLDWMLEGAQRIIQRGRLMSDAELPAAVRQAKQDARNNSDSIRGWADEMRVSRQDGHWMTLKEVYANYKAWCIVQEYSEKEILTSRQFWRGMAAAGLCRPARKSHKQVGESYEIEILGRATDAVREWATAVRVTTETGMAMTPDAIVEHYAKWAADRVGRKILHDRQILPPAQFLKALEVAGYIDTRQPLKGMQDGREVEGYKLEIRGEIPAKELLADIPKYPDQTKEAVR